MDQCPRRDFGDAGTKKFLDSSKNDTKANLQENIPVKVRKHSLSPAFLEGGGRLCIYHSDKTFFTKSKDVL